MAYFLSLGQKCLATAQSLFGSLALGNVSLKGHQTAVGARIHVILHPLTQRRIIKFIRDWYSFSQDALDIFLVRHVRELVPRHFSDEMRRILAEDLHLLCRVFVEIGESSVAA